MANAHPLKLNAGVHGGMLTIILECNDFSNGLGEGGGEHRQFAGNFRHTRREMPLRRAGEPTVAPPSLAAAASQDYAEGQHDQLQV